MTGTIIFFATGLLAAAGKPKTDKQLAKAISGLFTTTVTGLVILALYFFYVAFV